MIRPFFIITILWQKGLLKLSFDVTLNSMSGSTTKTSIKYYIGERTNEMFYEPP